jgi:putative ABC transport system ATP-binding protein
MIELRDVTRSFGDVTPLRGVDFQVREGEFVAIVGPSGSGKSTLLNIIAGLLTPDRGEVMVLGRSLYRLDRRARVAFRRVHFGFIFQAFNLIPYLTAIENVEIPLYLSGVDRSGQADVARVLLDRVGLADKWDRLPSQLSTGEQQRVAVARALANQPRVIFADEPTGNLDGERGREIVGCIRDLNRNGVTVLLVTHDLEIAGYAERTVYLNEGRLLTS